jgi:non-ribosomal peptide synthetase component F
MASSFSSLIEDLCSRPNISVSHAQILSPSDLNLVLNTWNDTKVDYSMRTKHPIHVVFEQLASKTPFSLALTHGNRCWTYKQLNERSNQLAHYLRHQGVQCGAHVAVCCKRSIDMVISMIAVMKAGAAYVACDPAYPSNRLQYMFEDANVSVILGHSFIEDRLKKDGCTLLLLDTMWEGLKDKYPNSNLVCNITVKDVINVMYTSGKISTVFCGFIISDYKFVKIK